MNTHGQAVDSRGRVHVVMWHCSDESLQAAGSRPGASRWGPPKARRYHHYRRERKGRWRHTELPPAAGTRPKIFTDTEDNAYVAYTDSWSRGIFFSKGTLTILAATSKSGWKDWKAIYVGKSPFGNEILIDYYRWKRDKRLSVMVQESPKKPHEATPPRIPDFTFDSPAAGRAKGKQ